MAKMPDLYRLRKCAFNLCFPGIQVTTVAETKEAVKPLKIEVHATAMHHEQVSMSISFPFFVTDAAQK